MPLILDMALPLEMKGSVQMTAVGIPLASSSIPSCTLHDEQDPQSPEEVITTSHSSCSSSMIGVGQGRDALPLFLNTMDLKS